MYLLVIIVTLFLPLSYYTFKKDFASPSFLFFVGYFIAAVAAAYNIIAWEIDISDRLIFVFLIGWFSFFIGELFTREILYRESRRGNNLKYDNTIKSIYVERKKVWFFIIIDIVVTYFLYREVIRIAGNDGSSTFENLMYNYKTNLLETNMSTLVTQTTKITKGAAYVFLFVFVNNIVNAGKVDIRILWKNCIYMVPGIIYCIQCFLRGGRYTVIAYIIAVVFMFYFFIQYNNKWKYKVKLRTIIKMLGLVYGIFIGFWLVKEIVGRSSTATFLEYITRYIGGPYELFNIYLKDPPSKEYETFAGLLTSFNKIGITDCSVRAYHEFRFSTTGVLLGNVYTGFRTYYNDFGLIGVGTLSFLLSVIFNIVYHKLRKSSIYNKKFVLILYSSLLYCIVFNFLLIIFIQDYQ
ncbi:MAG: oligosaccharide repeat unit polymerase [Lachnospiraceae bacterium]|nr:oligosaccharide repeat unit polymerase [Lachnospiraceae bacterium]